MFRIPIIAATIVSLAPATPASAQSLDPQQQGLGGPVVPGVCLLSREAIYANAAVAKASTARLAELTRTAQAAIDAQRTPLETEVKALQGQPDNAETRQKRDALAARWNDLQKRAAHDSSEIDATRAKVMERISTEAQPVISQVYASKKCGLLLDRKSALGGNFANDLTADVVKGLDAKIQNFAFERERLPEQPQ
ncbi:MAG: OmpH family outer membrane protein [Tsuneonella suprasediminis]